MPTPIHKPLSESELVRLDEFLASVKGGAAMSIEELDGFFNALIVGPDLVMPSEYWPEVIGADPAQVEVFQTLEQAQEMMGLMMRHWNTIARTLANGEPYVPVLLADERGQVRGNDWAIGFLRGIDMRAAQWEGLLGNGEEDEDEDEDEEEDANLLLPMFALAHENDPDPRLRFDLPQPEAREEMLAEMMLVVMKIHAYFRERAAALANDPSSASTPFEAALKTGKDDPCLCGSGKAFGACCGASVH